MKRRDLISTLEEMGCVYERFGTDQNTGVAGILGISESAQQTTGDTI